MSGRSRQSSLDKLDTACGGTESDFAAACDRQGMNGMLEIMMQDLQSSTRHVYTLGASKSEHEKGMSQQREQLLRQRRETRHTLLPAAGTEGSYLRAIVRAWRVVSKLLSVDRTVSRLLRKQRDSVRDRLLLELQEAWRTRQLATAWQLCRRIARTKRGSRRKWALLPRTANPTAEGLLGLLRLPGCLGGWEAQVVEERSDDSQAECSHDIALDEVQQCSMPRHEAIFYAQQDLEDIRRQVIGAKFRVSSPGWDVPSEIWRMVVWPSRVRNARTAGLGADNIIQGALA